MQKIIAAALDFLKNRVFFGDEDLKDVEVREKKVFDKAIEIEFGNLTQLSGFKPYEDSHSNRISSSKWQVMVTISSCIQNIQFKVIGKFSSIFAKFIKRMSVWLIIVTLLVGMVVASSKLLWQNQYFSHSKGEICLMYLIPMLLQFLTFFFREFNSFKLNSVQNEIIDKQNCTIFKAFKKSKQNTLHQQDILDIEDKDQPSPRNQQKRTSLTKKDRQESMNDQQIDKIEINGLTAEKLISKNGVQGIPICLLNEAQDPHQISFKQQIPNQFEEKEPVVLEPNDSKIKNGQPKIVNKNSILHQNISPSQQYQGSSFMGGSQINSKTVKLFEDIKWEQVEVGNIIWLKKGEVAPADMLLLDTRQSFCTVEEETINGKTIFTDKHPPQLTSDIDFHQIVQVSVQSKLKTSIFEYRKLLSGKIEFSRQSRRKEFSGFIKMFKDPKGENLGVSNLIYRGSRLTFSDWVFGLVIYVGKDCKIYQESSCKEGPHSSFFGNKAKLFFMITYFHILLSAAISTIFVMLHPCSSNSLEKKLDLVGVLMSFILDYLHIMPQLWYAVIDLIEIVNAVYHNKRYLKQIISSDSTIQNSYQIINSVSLGDVALTNYVFLDKTGTITEGDNLRVKSVIINSRVYFLEESKIKSIFQAKDILLNLNYKKSLKEIHESQLMPIADEKNGNRGQNQIKFQEFQLFKSCSIVCDESCILSPRLETKLKKQPLLNLFKGVVSKIKSKLTEDYDEEENKDEVKNSLTSTQFNNSGSGNFNGFYPILQESSLNTSLLPQDPPRSERTQYSKVSEGSKTGSQKLSSRSGIEIKMLEEAQFIKCLNKMEDKQHHECLLAIVMCNQIISQFDHSKDQIINSHLSKEAEVTSKFASLFQYNLKCSSVNKGQQNSPNYIINIGGNYISYKILAINEATLNRPFFSILFRDPNSTFPNTGSILFTKALLKNMEIPSSIIFENKDSRTMLEKQIYQLILQGMRPIIYCKRELNEEQTDDYLRQYENLKKNLVQDKNKLELLYSDIEKDLQIISVIGITEKLRKGADSIVKQMRLAGLNPWMLTGDSYLSAISTGYLSNVIDPDSQVLHLEGKNYDQIKFLIREQLNQIQNESKFGKLLPQNPQAYKNYLYNSFAFSLQSPSQTKGDDSSRKVSENQGNNSTQTPLQNNNYKTNLTDFNHLLSNVGGSININRKKSISTNQNVKPFIFSIVVSSEALTTIFSDIYLRNHFFFLSYFCSSLIGYDLQANQKGWIARMVKQKFPQNPRTIAIGDSYSDKDVNIL